MNSPASKTDSTSDSIEAVGRALRADEVSATEILSQCLAAIERDNPRLRALVSIDPGTALHAAIALDVELASGQDRGPLHGIPVVVKDTLDVAGMPTIGGSATFTRIAASRDAAVVARLRTAGAIILGKATTWELGCGVGELQTRATSAEAHNPVDPAYFSGGSSSGSAVAVAAGFAYGAVGADTGGSIRSPASACGIAGLKPSFGAVERDGAFAHSTSLDHVGPMARQASDLLALQAAMLGMPAINFPATGLDGARFAVVREWIEDAQLDAAVADNFESRIAQLRSAGALVEFRSIGAPVTEWRKVMEIIGGFESLSRNRHLLDMPDAISPSILTWLESAAQITPQRYWDALAQREALTARLQTLMSEQDFLACPAAGNRVPRADDEAGRVTYSLNSVNAIYNLSGHPALSIPTGFDDRGLPLGMQVATRRGADFRLLQMGCAMEEVFTAGNAP
ncbi:MAG: amidase [Moraxellaceae bacterium]|nr:amidase [Moraxellaceae bacterium]